MRKWVVAGLFVVLTGGLGACAAREEPPEEGVSASEAMGAESPAMMNDGRTVAQRLEDATTATQVQRALLDTMSLRLFDFEVEAVRGRVALRGSVDTEAQRELASRIAREVDGVRDLVNQIALFPPDSADVATDSTVKGLL